MKGAARNYSDEDSIYLCKQIQYHYKTEIGKYLLLLGINFVEVSGAVFYYLQLIFQYFISTYTSVLVERNTSSHIPMEQCAVINNSMLIKYQIGTSAIPLLTTLRALGNVADMFVVGLGVCLMNYLIGRMKNCHTMIMDIRRFILILSVISMFIILTSYFTFFIILSKVVFLPALTVYYVKFLIYVKRFKQALLQIAIERLAQHGSNEMEMKQYLYFSYSMNTICIGFFLITTSAYIGNIVRVFSCAVLFGNCYFPFNLLHFTGYMTMPTNKEIDVPMIVKILLYIDKSTEAVACTGIILFISPFICITLYTWIIIVYRKIRGKSAVQFRYPVSSH